MEARRGNLDIIFQAARPAVLLGLVFSLSGCEVIKGIFKAGMGVGIAVTIFVVMIAGGILALVMRKA